jgi:outer membrane lipoprotein-sorting protein
MCWLAVLALANGFAAGTLGGEAAPASTLTATQIVEKNAAARGGLEAWRNIQTMIWVGHLEGASAPTPSATFVLQQKRPNWTRLETTAKDEKTLRVFDGAHGWQMRAISGGGPELRPYTPEELKFATEAQGADGPLIDYQAKGNAVALEGIETVEGREAYRLGVRLAAGQHQTVWIDAQTFLDIRYDRASYDAAGVAKTVSVSYRDYRTIGGLQIPVTVETSVGSGSAADKMVMERIALNPPLDDGAFTNPAAPSRHPSVTISPEAAPGAATPDPGPAPR